MSETALQKCPLCGRETQLKIIKNTNIKADPIAYSCEYCKDYSILKSVCILLNKATEQQRKHLSKLSCNYFLANPLNNINPFRVSESIISSAVGYVPINALEQLQYM